MVELAVVLFPIACFASFWPLATSQLYGPQYVSSTISSTPKYGIICYHTNITDESAAVTANPYQRNQQLGVPVGYPGYQQNRMLEMSGCEACQKYTVQYVSAGLQYSTEQYQCMTGYYSLPPATGCSKTFTASSRADGSMTTRTCVCCTDRCNSDQFCTDLDPDIQAFSITFGKNKYRCDGEAVYSPKPLIYLLTTLTALAYNSNFY